MQYIETNAGVVPYRDVPNKDIKLGLSAYKKSPGFFLNQKKDTRIINPEKHYAFKIPENWTSTSGEKSSTMRIPRKHTNLLRRVANSPQEGQGLYFPMGKNPTKEEQLYKGIPMIKTLPNTRELDETTIHENVHANQNRNINKRAKGIDTGSLKRSLNSNEYLAELKRQGYDMSRNTYEEQLAYYAQRDAGASDPRQTMNELRAGWEPRAWWQDQMGQTDPYHTYLSEVHGGPYMLPREPSLLERIRDAIQ